MYAVALVHEDLLEREAQLKLNIATLNREMENVSKLTTMSMETASTNWHGIVVTITSDIERIVRHNRDHFDTRLDAIER